MKYNKKEDDLMFAMGFFLFNNGKYVIDQSCVSPEDIAEANDFELKNKGDDNEAPYIIEFDFEGNDVIVPIDEDFEFTETQLVNYATILIEKFNKGEDVEGVMIVESINDGA